MDSFEIKSKGWLSNVRVELENGSTHELTIYDPVRLRQDLEAEVAGGKAGIIEKGLLVVPEVTKECIEKIISQAFREKFFAN